jgi:hypothetical protein
MIKTIQNEPLACFIILLFVIVIIALNLPKKRASKPKMTKRRANAVLKSGIKKTVQKRNPASSYKPNILPKGYTTEVGLFKS